MRPAWAEDPATLREARETVPLVGGASPGVERAYRFLIHPRVRNATRERQIEFLEAKKCLPGDIERALDKVAAEGGDEAGAPDDDDEDEAPTASSLFRGFAGLFAPLSRITSGAASSRADGDTDRDDDADDEEDRAPGKRSGKRGRRRSSDRRATRSRSQFYANACASCCLCLLVVVPTVAWLLYYFDLDANVATIVRCLHTRCSR